MQINVNKPYLPDRKKYEKYLDIIWKSNHLTNFGPLHKKLSDELCKFLNIENILLVNNGTIALQIAYKLLNLKPNDEVITTPFSFVATSNTLYWENLKAIFVDIKKNSFCIDENLIEKNINSNTKAILPVHVFGNPCEMDLLENIAKKYKLKLIYDAAHAFGIKFNNKSVFNYGNISTISFHATKIFHTIEGGAIIAKNKDIIDEAFSMINFGLKNNEPEILGINAKTSEFNAAMGLCVLEDMHIILEQRQKAFEYYESKLKDYFFMQEWNKNANKNYHYFPIVFDNEEKLINTLKNLNNENIFPRRYFYPSLESLSFYNSQKNYSKENCPISKDIANKIICLPFYAQISKAEQDLVIQKLIKNL